MGSPKTIPVMEGVETITTPPSPSACAESPKTIPVMEGVETSSDLASEDGESPLRRLSPLWRGLRRNKLPFFGGEFVSPKTIPVMEGVETSVPFRTEPV